jgi:arylsulfatase A-like enzyme
MNCPRTNVAVRFIFSLWLLTNVTFAQQANKKHVILIAVDGLNDWVRALHVYPAVKTPNLDRLAKKGMIFTRAYCSAPLCNPSRASLLTGIRPSTSGVYNNGQPFRKVLPNAITMPQYFTANGYELIGAGKIFHEAYYDSASWPVPYEQFTSPTPSKTPVNGIRNFDWSPLDNGDEEMADYKIVQTGIEFLKQKHDKPFFLAIGLIKPHLPWYVPKKYFDLYPLSKIVLPKTIAGDLDDVPDFGKKAAAGHGEVNYNGDLQQFVFENKQWEKAVQGYLASISFADAQIGRLIDALEKSSYSTNTIIIFFSDHGFNLGEKQHWTKSVLWEESTKVPLIIVAPGITKPNTTCERTVSLMDIYPTLITLCNFHQKDSLEGIDISPLLKNPNQKWNHPSVSTMGRGNHAIRTERWRYIRYNDNSEELYDHSTDSHEWYNLAKDPKYADTIKKLSEWLPKSNAPPAPLADTTGRRVRE